MCFINVFMNTPKHEKYKGFFNTMGGINILDKYTVLKIFKGTPDNVCPRPIDKAYISKDNKAESQFSLLAQAIALDYNLFWVKQSLLKSMNQICNF